MAKRAHRTASLARGYVGRGTRGLQGDRAVPARGTYDVAETQALEPDAVRVHRAGEAVQVDRPAPEGRPDFRWVFEPFRQHAFPQPFTLDITGGTVVGTYGAVVTPGGTLDYQTSEYFGLRSWREHPIFLRNRLPEIENIDGTVVVLAARGGNDNYFHFVTDVIPRWGTFQQTMPGCRPDAIYVPHKSRYQRELLDLIGLSDVPLIQSDKDRAIRATRLAVPWIGNHGEFAPPSTVEWLRSALPAKDVASRPKRIYVTRGSQKNTRRFVREAELVAALEKRGFAVIDPGSLSVQDQIDHFAAADVIVGPHGAALTNLVFAREGARILELFGPTYVKACFWTLTANIPGVEHRYLVGGSAAEARRRRPMNRVQDDIDIDPALVIAEVDRLLDA
jgi:capsular polysaccharide biosynthesis protein